MNDPQPLTQASRSAPEPAQAALTGLSRLERFGLMATRALSALGLAGLMFLALMTLFDGLARWLLNQPIEGSETWPQ